MDDASQLRPIAFRLAAAVFVVALFLIPTAQASSTVSFSAPYSGFTVVRNITSFSTGPGSNASCGVYARTPVPGSFGLTNGSARLKVSASVEPCGGATAMFNYSGQLGAASRNFTVAHSLSSWLGCVWLTGYLIVINVTGPSPANGSIWARGQMSLSCALIDRTTGVMVSKSRLLWYGSQWRGLSITRQDPHRTQVTRAVHLTAGDRYSIVSSIQFDFAAGALASVPFGYSASWFVEMAPSPLHHLRQATLELVIIS
jgi:hypothetical protein